MELPSNPQRFQVRHRSAAANVPQKIRPPEHAGNYCDGFFPHRGRGAPAIQSMIVGIDPHGQGISHTRHGVGRFQHLPCIKRMKIRIVIPKAFGRGGQYFRKTLCSRGVGLKFWEPGKPRIQFLHSLQKHSQTFVIQHSPVSALLCP